MEENQIDKIIDVNIEDEMKESYIAYAMSVIISRALPDVRDGLKPVHRRILYAMDELNLDPSKGYRKCARIVGDTMGKYHPHGNSSIYQALVRLAQKFSTRYMLVDGHGNFGSIDGDGAAAERYTEARLSKISMEMLADIEKNTVDFRPNFDETESEPVVLPARVPNLLINGSSGIAVGMATNIPPHNLKEVIDAVIKIIDNKVLENRETEIDELLTLVKGPDFPTGANILGRSGIRASYKTGRGKIIVRATCEIVTNKNNQESIIVTEIPYQVNKAKLVEKIADLVKEKKVEGITGLDDETDRNGMRIVIEIKKDANANVILNQLYKYTSLQESFGVIMLALVDGVPKTLNLKEILELYLKHQIEIITRRTIFDLEKAEKRAHILEGLRIAIDNIDEVLNIIRSSPNTNAAKEKLAERFTLTDLQTTAIVDTRFRALTGLEREKLDTEFDELMEKIKYLKTILEDENMKYTTVKDEIVIMQNKYKDERRTQILDNPGEIDIEDLIDEEICVFTMSNLNYIKRLPLTTYKSQNRGGRGIMGMQTREEDFVRDIFLGNTHDHILFFTSKGKVYNKKGYEIPEASRTARGTAIINIMGIEPGETIKSILPLNKFEENSFIVMVTKMGIIKKVNLMTFSNIRKGGLQAINFREDDELIAVFITDGNSDIIVATKNGSGIKFNENDVRATGRAAVGVRAIKLKNDDIIIGANVIKDGVRVLNVTENGYGKCTFAENYNVQKRSGTGVKIHQITEKTGKLAGILTIEDDDEIMLITSEGIIIRIRGNEISTFGRVSQGVKLMNLDNDINVVSIAKIRAEYIEIMEDDEENIENENTDDEIINDVENNTNVVMEKNTDDTEEN